MFAQEAVRLIESHDQDESFFLYLAMQDVHEPVSAPANYIALHSDIKDSTRRTYACRTPGLTWQADNGQSPFMPALSVRAVFR